jgi:acyl carrier protein
MTEKIMNHEIEKPIRDFIASRLLYSKEGFTYPDDTSLLREGIIDSLGVVELVEFLQGHFTLNIEQQEVRPDNFDSVAKMAAYVRRKQGVVASTPAAPAAG